MGGVVGLKTGGQFDTPPLSGLLKAIIVFLKGLRADFGSLDRVWGGFRRVWGKVWTGFGRVFGNICLKFWVKVSNVAQELHKVTSR